MFEFPSQSSSSISAMLAGDVLGDLSKHKAQPAQSAQAPPTVPFDDQHKLDVLFDDPDDVTARDHDDTSSSQLNPMYSVHSSVSSFSSPFCFVPSPNESRRRIRICANRLQHLRHRTLREIQREVHIFQGAVSEFTSSIPILSALLVSSFVSRSTRSHSPRSREQQMKKVQHENSGLKRENAWLREQLRCITSTALISHQQMTELHDRHRQKEQRLLDKLERLENPTDDDSMHAEFNEVHGVIIFEKLDSPQKMKMSTRRRTRSCRTRPNGTTKPLTNLNSSCIGLSHSNSRKRMRSNANSPSVFAQPRPKTAISTSEALARFGRSKKRPSTALSLTEIPKPKPRPRLSLNAPPRRMRRMSDQPRSWTSVPETANARDANSNLNQSAIAPSTSRLIPRPRNSLAAIRKARASSDRWADRCRRINK